MAEKEELTYRAAAEEIEQILQAIEDEREVDIDELAGRVERAAELIRFCHERLKGAEIRIHRVTEELARAAPGSDAELTARAEEDAEEEDPEVPF